MKLQLSRGNPRPANVGQDFGRLGFLLWSAVDAQSTQTPARRAALMELNDWRNAVAHQDFDPVKLGGRTAILRSDVRHWRSACNGLVASLDVVIRRRIRAITGSAPWPP